MVGTSLTSADGSLTTSEQYGYDQDGDLATLTDPNGKIWKATYDAAGRRISTTDPTPATASGTSLAAPTTSTGYDAAGDPTQSTDGNGNITLTTYNTWGLPVTRVLPATTAHPAATDRTWTTSYNAAGEPSTSTEPGGVTVASTYDLLGDLTSQTGTGGDRSTTRTLSYDLDRRLTSAGNPGGKIDFGWGDRGELLGGDYPSQLDDGYDDWMYRYDSVGRLTPVQRHPR